MVQFYKMNQDPRLRANEETGRAMGNSLAEITGNYFANKAFEQLLDSKDYEGKDTQEKLSALYRTMAPYGRFGQNVLNNALKLEEAEQVRQNTALRRQQQKRLEEESEIKQNLLHQILSGGSPSFDQQGFSDVLPVASSFEATRGQENMTYRPQEDITLEEDDYIPSSYEKTIPKRPQQYKPMIGQEHLSALALVDPQTARAMGDIGKAEYEKYSDLRKSYEGDRDFHTKAAEKYAEKIEKLEKDQSQIEIAKQAMSTAIRSGKLNPGTLNHLAEVTGIDALKDPSGAAFSSAVKTFAIPTISQITGPKNLYIEKNVVDSFPKIGRSQEANEASFLIVDLESELANKKIDIYNKLSQGDIDRYGFVTRDIGKRVDQQLREYAEPRIKTVSLNLQRLQEKQNKVDESMTLKQVTPGTPLTKRMAEILIYKKKGDVQGANKLAKDLGYDTSIPANIYELAYEKEF